MWRFCVKQHSRNKVERSIDRDFQRFCCPRIKFRENLTAFPQNPPFAPVHVNNTRYIIVTITRACRVHDLDARDRVRGARAYVRVCVVWRIVIMVVLHESAVRFSPCIRRHRMVFFFASSTDRTRI